MIPNFRKDMVAACEDPILKYAVKVFLAGYSEQQVAEEIKSNPDIPSASTNKLRNYVRDLKRGVINV